MPKVFTILLALWALNPSYLFALTVEIGIQENEGIDFKCLLNRPATEQEKRVILQICTLLNTDYGDTLCALPLINDPDFVEEGIGIKGVNEKFLQRNLNFLDFKRRRSFFREKYYLKVIVNREIMNSIFFQKIDERLHGLIDWPGFLKGDSQLNLIVRGPGRCLKTNMDEKNDYYLRQIYLSDFAAGTRFIMFESIRFFQQIYLSIFAILLILVSLAVKLMKISRKNPENAI